MKKHKKRNGWKEIIKNHFLNNLRQYLIVIIIFIIGIIFGVVFINNATEEQMQEIGDYIGDFITSVKESSNEDSKSHLLLLSIKDNLALVLLLWFVGLAVIGVPIICLVVLFRGFCLGYTISAAISTLGFKQGMLFSVFSLFLQNILFIPCLLAISVSGIKLYQSIMKDKRKENIKLEIVRHTLFSVIMLIIMIISSLIEVYGSKTILTFCLPYIVT